MYISVRNAKDRYLTTLLKSATKYYAQILMSPQLTKNLSIKITIDNLDKYVYAYCVPEELETRLRSFEIQIRKTRINKMLRLLAHEMVHVKQFAKNELKEKYFKDGNKTLWHGRICNIESYWDQPWEIEAFALEEELFHYFKKEYYN